MPRPGGIRGARYLNATPPPDDPYGRIRAAAIGTSERAVITGWSAAVLSGVPTEFIDGTRGDHVRPVSVHPRGKHHQREGITFTYSHLDNDDVVMLGDVLVTNGVRTAFDCIRFARDRAEALAEADACFRFGLATPEELMDYAKARRRWPGIRRVRELIPLMSPFAESPRESWMRLTWVDAGLPFPWVNPSIYAPDGSHLARVDLLDPETGLVGEYDGFWHQLGERPEQDAERARLLRLCRLKSEVADARDLADGGAALGSRLRFARDDMLRRGSRPAPFIRIEPQQRRPRRDRAT